MPSVTAEHPSADQLRAYDLGLLEEPERQGVEEHLAACDGCCNALAATAADPFLTRVRQALASSTEPAWEPQRSIGNYRLLEELGRGGMGVVYKAVDGTVPEHLVALKTLRADLVHHPGARERFLREVRTMARLQHDHIVPIKYIGEHNGVPYFTMPLLQGETLDSRLSREDRLPLAEVLRIGREIALGLAAAHDLGLIHRDVKPSNIWLEGPSPPTPLPSGERGVRWATPLPSGERGEDFPPLSPLGRGVGGEGGRVKLLDFGLAHDCGQSGCADAGAVLGTPAFMAPEQVKGQPVDARCDLFGLGCVLYQLCVGQSPFQRETVSASLQAVQEHAPTSVTHLRSDIPAALGRLIDRLMAKDPQGRLPSARQLAEELRAIEQALAVAPWRRQQRIGAVAALVLGLLGLTAWAVWSGLANHSSSPQTSPAKGEGERKGPAAAEVSPFDALDPARMAPEERFPNMPGEVVAALGRREIGKWDVVSGYGRFLAISPDGKSVLVQRGGAALLFDVASGRQVHCFQRRFVGGGVAFSPDGRRVLCGGLEELGSPSCTLWETATGKIIRQIGPEQCVIFWVAFDPADREGTRALVAHRDYHDGPATIVLRDLATGASLRIYKGHAHYTHAGAFLPDGRQFVSCGSYRDPAIRLWDVDTEKEVRRFQLKPASALHPHGLALSADGRYVFSAGSVDGARGPGKAALWDIQAEGSSPQVVLHHSRALRAVALAPDGKTMAAVDWDARVVVWECPSGKLLREIQLEPAPVQVWADLAYAPDGRHLLVAHGSGAIYVLRLSPTPVQ